MFAVHHQDDHADSVGKELEVQDWVLDIVEVWYQGEPVEDGKPLPQRYDTDAGTAHAYFQMLYS